MLLRSKGDMLIALFAYSKILSRLMKQDSANPLWNNFWFMAFSFDTLDKSHSLTSWPTACSEQMASVTQMMHSKFSESKDFFCFFLVKVNTSRETTWETTLENASFPKHLPSKELHNWGNNNGTHKATDGKNWNSYWPEESQCAFIHWEAISPLPGFIVKLLDILKENT